MISINDVWRQFDSPLQVEQHVLLADYADLLEKLVSQTRPRLKGLVLMTPFMIEPNRTDAVRAMMDSYGAVVRAVAERHDAICVDTQAAPAGHMVIARVSKHRRVLGMRSTHARVGAKQWARI